MTGRIFTAGSFSRECGRSKELNNAITLLTGKETEVTGASRTDAGVHAMGNVAVFDTEATVPPERFAQALNTYLPEDVKVRSSEEVPADFHPRKVRCRKVYGRSMKTIKSLRRMQNRSRASSSRPESSQMSRCF